MEKVRYGRQLTEEMVVSLRVGRDLARILPSQLSQLARKQRRSECGRTEGPGTARFVQSC